jgi:hypothetical protein
MKFEKAVSDHNTVPQPFANNTVLLKLDLSTKKILEKKLRMVQNQKTKELILLDNYLKSLKTTEKQLKSIEKDQADFNLKTTSKKITKECKLVV